MKYITSPDTAKLVRLVLKESFPGQKFSVRSDASSIDVRWHDGPSAKTVDDCIGIFSGSYFDGVTDYRGVRYRTLDGAPVRFCSDRVVTHRRVSKPIAEAMVSAILAKPGRFADWLQLRGNDEDGYWVAMGPHAPNMSLDIEEYEKAHSPQAQESPTRARVKCAGDDRQPPKVHMDERLFPAVFSTGIVYADRQREVAGDYKRLAFLSFGTLELTIEADCPPELRDQITNHAVEIQARKDQPYGISTAGQYIILGHELTRGVPPGGPDDKIPSERCRLPDESQ